MRRHMGRSHRAYRMIEPREYRREYTRNYAEDVENDVKELTRELEKRDKYGMSKEQVVNKAESMGAKMRDYNEKELYLTYLMMECDYGDITNDPTHFIKMAINFLEDDDAELTGREKLEAYISTIVYGDY